jgi:hypothetical protein
MTPGQRRFPARDQPLPLEGSTVLFVEGPDDFYFMDALLDEIGIGGSVQLRPFHGKDRLTAELKFLVTVRDFSNIVASIGIVRDADEDAEDAFLSVRTSLRNAGLPEPRSPGVLASGTPTVSVYIVPDCQRPGSLETLCLEAVRDDSAMPCVDEYFECLRRRDVVLPRDSQMDKARVHAFLVSRERPHLRLGEAARAGYFPFDRPAFAPLREFLRELAEPSPR